MRYAPITLNYQLLPLALLREYRTLALNGLSDNNLDAIGHSETSHSIQDRALEHQLFELFINLARLRPVASVSGCGRCASSWQKKHITSLHPQLLTQFRATKPFDLVISLKAIKLLSLTFCDCS
jgi:hypothetical protein